MFGVVFDVQWQQFSDYNNVFFRVFESPPTEDNVFPVVTVRAIVKWELMFEAMPNVARILSVPPVWVVAFVQMFALEAY